jgi:hypothetical protein
MSNQRAQRIEWVNLSFHHLPWTPDGIASARQILSERQAALEREGWVANRAAADYGILRRSRKLRGSVIIGARLELRRAS